MHHIVRKFENLTTKPSDFRGLINTLRLKGVLNEASRIAVGRQDWGSDDLIISTNNYPYTLKEGQSFDLTITGEQADVSAATRLIQEWLGLRTSDLILTEEVEYHNELNPKIWTKEDGEYRIQKDVGTALLKAADKFIEYVGFEDKILPGVEIEDIIVTGSMANYNWTSESDIDLHVLVSTKGVTPKYKDAILALFDAKRKIWNMEHDISMNGFPVEFYVQDLDEDHNSTGFYSLCDNVWLEKPTHNPPDVKDSAVQSKYKSLLSLIKAALKSEKASVTQNAFDKLIDARKVGLEKGGEFSVENVAFKLLRAEGWVEKLANHKGETFDEELSLNESALIALP